MTKVKTGKIEYILLKKIDQEREESFHTACVRPVFVQPVFVQHLFVQPVFVKSILSNPIRLGYVRLG